MSLHRYNARRDATEPGIVKALRRAGADVLRLDAFDLLVLFRQDLYMIDAKTEKGATTASQDDLIVRGWPLHLVRDELAALRVIGCLPPESK